MCMLYFLVFVTVIKVKVKDLNQFTQGQREKKRESKANEIGVCGKGKGLLMDMLCLLCKLTIM